MKDYWNDLTLAQKWSKIERFNYIMNYIDSKVTSSSGANDEED